MSSFEVKGNLHNARYRAEKLHGELQKVQPLLRSRSDVQKPPDCELHIRLSDAHAQIVRNSSRTVIGFLKVLDFQKCVAEQTTAQNIRAELEQAKGGHWIQVQFSDTEALSFVLARGGFRNQDVFESSQIATRYDASKKYHDVVPVLLCSLASSTDVTILYSSTNAFFITTSSKGLSGLVQSEALESYNMPNLQSFQMPSSGVVSLQPATAQAPNAGAAAASRARTKLSNRKRKSRSPRTTRPAASAAATSHETSQAADVEVEPTAPASAAEEFHQQELSFSQASQDSTDDADSSDEEQQDQTEEPPAKRQRVETFLQEQIMVYADDADIHEPDGDAVEEFPRALGGAPPATIFKFTGEFFIRKCDNDKNVLVCINVGDQISQIDINLPTGFSGYFRFAGTNQEALQAVNADAAHHAAEQIRETSIISPDPLIQPIKTEEPEDEYDPATAFVGTPF